MGDVLDVIEKKDGENSVVCRELDLVDTLEAGVTGRKLSACLIQALGEKVAWGIVKLLDNLLGALIETFDSDCAADGDANGTRDRVQSAAKVE